MNRDIVYIIKDGIVSEELKYSLRTVEANFPHRLVWFVGGRRAGLKPDRALNHRQYGPTKWDLIKSSMLEVVKQPELSDEFYLFNDDFFVMKPFTGNFINYADRTLTDRVEDFRLESASLNHYARTLLQARDELKALGYDEINFDVHLPMLFEKSKVTGSIKQCKSPQMRSVYGNINDVPFIDRRDVKVYRLDTIPEDMDFVSTNDRTFIHGDIGRYIRETYTTPSRFEVRE